MVSLRTLLCYLGNVIVYSALLRFITAVNNPLSLMRKELSCESLVEEVRRKLDNFYITFHYITLVAIFLCIYVLRINVIYTLLVLPFMLLLCS
jgi:hypothetical protein